MNSKAKPVRTSRIRLVKSSIGSYSRETLLKLYRGILMPRMIEEKMLLLLRQGRISKWFSGIGQEAISVGCAMAMTDDEYILPLHRNLGVFTTRGVPLTRLFSQWQGNANGFTKGRDRSFHFGTNEFRIVGMISHLGPQLCVADGIGLAEKLSRSGRAALVFTGEGGTSQGDFHEALNVASVWSLPVIFVIENNGYGLSTPAAEQYRCERLSDRARGYGMEGVTIDGNSILEVYDTISSLAENVRRTSRPILVECMTFRMRGHEEASGTKYVPPELFEKWAAKDPVATYEKLLMEEGIIDLAQASSVRAEIAAEIEQAIEIAFNEASITADTEVELEDIYALPRPVSVPPAVGPRTEKRFVDAVSDGLRAGMRRHPELILMGQDIAEYGGVFKVTEGFVEEFGRERVRNTPLCESAILGAALGLSVRGFKSVVEMQFADFVSCGFNQIVNNLAKSHWRWGQNSDVVVRLPTGGGSGAGPFHSQSIEAWFAHVPGLKIVHPAFPGDAKGLLLAAIDDPNPVLFFEHKLLYRSVKEVIADDYFTIEIGKANVVREGDEVTVLTYGTGVHWALAARERHPQISMMIVDLRTLLPLDLETIFSAVRHTGRAVILHEATLNGGIGAEVAARIAEHCFEYLDAPLVRCCSLDTPVPFGADLERNFMAKSRFDDALLRLVRY